MTYEELLKLSGKEFAEYLTKHGIPLDDVNHWARHASLKDLRDADAGTRGNPRRNAIIRERLLMYVTEAAFVASRESSKIIVRFTIATFVLTIAIVVLTVILVAFECRTHVFPKSINVSPVHPKQIPNHAHTEPNHPDTGVPDGNKPSATVPDPPDPNSDADPEQNDGDDDDKRLP